MPPPRAFLSLVAVAAAAASSSPSSSSSSSSSSSPTYLPATSPFVVVQGRTMPSSSSSSDPSGGGGGGLQFDWEGVQFYLTIANATYLYVNATGPPASPTKFHTFIDGTEGTTVFVSSSTQDTGPASNSLTLLVGGSQGLMSGAQARTYKIWHSLEPGKISAWSGPVNVYGFLTDGVVLPTQPPARRIEFIGDSITAGSGGVGFGPCAESILTTDHAHSYGQYICANFSAGCSTVAWSGKGLWKNCCDPPPPQPQSPLVPQLWRQTLGYNASTVWDFSRFVPDAVFINLGTNDYNSRNNPSAPGFQQNFTNAYVQFVQDIAAAYGGNKALPVFAGVGAITDDYLAGVQGAITALNSQGYNVTLVEMFPGIPCTGCNGHPGLPGHIAMSQVAIPIMRSVLGW